MAFCTRIDSRSPCNNSFTIKSVDGETIAVIKAMSKTIELSIETTPKYRVEKQEGAKHESKP